MLKPIETVYKGYKFRSRLEARWAVFFDTLGIEYQYEKEGYDLDGVWYLPDFWLPRFQLWVEVKGDTPTSDEQEKSAHLAEKSKKRAIILYGDIPLPEKDFHPKSFIVGLLPNGSAALGLNLGHYWCQCPLCCTIGFTNPSKPFPPVCLCSYQQPHLAECVVRPRFNSPYLLEAYKTARMARFEHEDAKPKHKMNVNAESASAPSLTIEQFKDRLDRIEKRARSKKGGNKTAALLKHFAVSAVEGTKELPVIVLQTNDLFAHGVLSQDTHRSCLEWAASYELNHECKFRFEYL